MSQLARTANINRYKDLDLNFTPHPVTGDISSLDGEAAIKRSIKNLVLMNFYEVPFNPSIGSEVYRLLFENFTPATESNIEQAITRTINKYEPRVEIEQVNASAEDDSNSLEVTIIFRIINQPEPINFSFVIQRNR